MRKVIAVVILIALGALLYFSPSIYQTKPEDPIERLSDANIEEEEILPLLKAAEGDLLDFDLEMLQGTPDQILTFNAKLMMVMYRYGEGVEPLTEEEIALLVRAQRQYYHEDLLEMNADEDFHILTAIKEIERAHKDEEWIVDYRVGAPVYDEKDSNTAVVTVTLIPSSVGASEDIYHQYLMERENGLWYIKGWRGIAPADVKRAE